MNQAHWPRQVRSATVDTQELEAERPLILLVLLVLLLLTILHYCYYYYFYYHPCLLLPNISKSNNNLSQISGVHAELFHQKGQSRLKVILHAERQQGRRACRQLSSTPFRRWR